MLLASGEEVCEYQRSSLSSALCPNSEPTRCFMRVKKEPLIILVSPSKKGNRLFSSGGLLSPHIENGLTSAKQLERELP